MFSIKLLLLLLAQWQPEALGVSLFLHQRAEIQKLNRVGRENQPNVFFFFCVRQKHESSTQMPEVCVKQLEGST